MAIPRAQNGPLLSGLRKPATYSGASLYAYSFALALLIAFFAGQFNIRMHADDLLSSLGAKLAPTPFLWEDSRIGYVTSYLLRPLRSLNIYTIFMAELVLKCAVTALLPFSLLLLAGKRAEGYLLIPAFYLITYSINDFTRDSLAGGVFHYYIASFGVFFSARLLERTLKSSGAFAKSSLTALLLFPLCLIAYWLNLSLILFTLPYLAYLTFKGEGSKTFLILNTLAYLPPFLLSHYVEIYGKSYMQPDFSVLMPFALAGRFFFVRNFSNALSMILLVMSVAEAVCGWRAFAVSRTDSQESGRRKTEFAASLFGLTVFWCAASQLNYVTLDFEGCGRYLTIWLLFVAFYAPMTLWEQVLHRVAQGKSCLWVTGAAVLANIAFLGVVADGFEWPVITPAPYVKALEKLAHDENATAVIAGSEKQSKSGGYWAIWPLFFHTLAERDSIEEAILPVVWRCGVLLPQINAVLATRTAFRALCIGDDVAACMRTTLECGFQNFSTPRVVKETRLPYADTYYEAQDMVMQGNALSYDKRPVKVTTLEFSRDGESGSLLPLLDVNPPARMTPAHTLHIPPDSMPFIAAETYGPALLPGDYRLSLNCILSGKNATAALPVADLAILFQAKDMIFKKVAFTGLDGLRNRDILFHVPYFAFFAPHVRFQLISTGKAALDCDRFRLVPL